jgi:hypothetical protein
MEAVNDRTNIWSKVHPKAKTALTKAYNKRFPQAGPDVVRKKVARARGAAGKEVERASEKAGARKRAAKASKVADLVPVMDEESEAAGSGDSADGMSGGAAAIAEDEEQREALRQSWGA